MLKYLVFIMLLCGVLCLPAIGRAESIPLTITGKGCWLQKNSLSNPAVSSDAFSWYITDSSNMVDAYALAGSLHRPLIMSYSGEYPGELINDGGLIDLHWEKIVAVVWDYEPATPASPTKVVEYMQNAYKKAHSKGLPFGIAVLSNPEDSKTTNRIDYANAPSFADFLMPMLYCQWWSCKSDTTKSLFQGEQDATRTTPMDPPLPLVVLTAIRASGPLLGCDPSLSVITPRLLLDNYAPLAAMPDPPKALGFYNVKDLDVALLSAIKVLPW